MRGVNNEVCFAICETEWGAYERFEWYIEYVVMASEKNHYFCPFLEGFGAYKAQFRNGSHIGEMFNMQY